MLNDQQLLDSIPDYVTFGTMMKASPVEEGGERFIYVEASRETRDQQGEVVLAKALKDSADVFRRFGVVDLDHKSMPAVAQRMGITNPDEWIIGQPADVRFKDGVTFVKAHLRRGDSPLAARANIVWEGLTKVAPPTRYYASVGGAVLGREVKIDPVTKDRVPVITKTRWNNLALSLNPVNPDLAPATTAPVGVFAKSLDGFVISKALEAGYGTDSATLTDGAALRKQSLHGTVQNYLQMREVLAGDVRSGKAGNKPGLRDLVRYCSGKFGLSLDEAAEFVERFVRDLKTSLN